MEEKEHWLVGMFNFYKRHKFIIESNIRHDEKELEERERLGRERGLTEDPVIPEGYIDRSKELREQIDISKKQLKECEEVISDIHKASLLV